MLGLSPNHASQGDIQRCKTGPRFLGYDAVVKENSQNSFAFTVPRFCQLFLEDPDYAWQVRANNEWTHGLNLSVVLPLDIVLREKNHWVARYRHVKEIVARLLQEREGDEFRVLCNPRLQLIAEAQSGVLNGRIQLPTAPEVALLIPDEIDDGRSN
ncbi:hypothetical protein GcM3_036029, partial [Golovinomyces cichoracearum]